MKRTKAQLGFFLFVLSSFQLSPLSAQARCGGTERWAVKVGTDPRAANVDVAHPGRISLQDLINLQEPSLLPQGDSSTRVQEETHLYVVRGHLIKFKLESDQDYHMVISDDTLSYTDDSAGLPPGHNFVAEIPDPNCIAGIHGNPNVQSRSIGNTRATRCAQHSYDGGLQRSVGDQCSNYGYQNLSRAFNPLGVFLEGDV